jgi:hypothetical protein
MKADLRAELANKNEHQNLDKRVAKLEADANILFEELDQAK